MGKSGGNLDELVEEEGPGDWMEPGASRKMSAVSTSRRAKGGLQVCLDRVAHSREKTILNTNNKMQINKQSFIVIIAKN